MSVRRHAPATERNRSPIAAVLARVLPPSARVLEVASGTGEHAVYFADHLEGLGLWQPSDPDPGAQASVEAWRSSARNPERIAACLQLDAAEGPWPSASFDAVVCINMIHIAPWEACLGLLAGASKVLQSPDSQGGPLFLYGPYKRDGRHTAPSNEAFDQSLRSRDPRWGVRDLGDVTRAAASEGFELVEIAEMPANNLSVVFRPRPGLVPGDFQPIPAP